jgi:hypothetical protein
MTPVHLTLRGGTASLGGFVAVSITALDDQCRPAGLGLFGESCLMFSSDPNSFWMAGLTHAAKLGHTGHKVGCFPRDKVAHYAYVHRADGSDRV